jgi:hypothetical protein
MMQFPFQSKCGVPGGFEPVRAVESAILARVHPDWLSAQAGFIIRRSPMRAALRPVCRNRKAFAS